MSSDVSRDPAPKTIKLPLSFGGRAFIYAAINMSRRCGVCRVDILAVNTVTEILMHAELVEKLGLEVFSGEFASALLENPETKDYEVSEAAGQRIHAALKRAGQYVSMITPFELSKIWSLLEPEYKDGGVTERVYKIYLKDEDRLVFCDLLKASVICTSCGTPTDGYQSQDWKKIELAVEAFNLAPWLRSMTANQPSTGINEYLVRRDVVEYLLPRFAVRVNMVPGGIKRSLNLIRQFEKIRVGEIAPVPE